MSQPPRSSSETTGHALQLEIGSDGVGVITFDLPGSRANTLGKAVLAEWEAVLGELEKRKDLAGLILRSGKPGMFIAGADLKELGAASSDPETVRSMLRRGHKLIGRLEDLPCPTLAAIDGACMGGGLEVALGFDIRLAGTHPKCDLGFPEVKVGLIPGWGGTQRLSRVIGPSLAAELICSGDAVPARRACELGFVFDVVPSERLMDEARAVLKLSKETGAWQEARRKKRQPVGLSEEQLSFALAVARAQVLAKTKGQLPAPLAAVEAIAKGCNRPLDEGLEAEVEAMTPLVGSPISRNLIAVFFMGQKLQKDTGVSDPAIKPRTVQRVGVLGAGTMGAGIAGAHVRRGVPAVMLDNDLKALERGAAAITGVMQARIGIGRMTQADMITALGRLSTTLSLRALADCDVVIEAVFENEEVKTRLYRELQPLLPADAILASNTSTISITRMAKTLSPLSPEGGRGVGVRGENFAGMHFFNPVDRMQLVEVIRGEKTSDATVATLVALARQIGKTPIVVRDCPGFLVNRILFPYMNEALALLEEGASPRAIDKAATAFGMPMGPITLNDVVGLDVARDAGAVVNTAFAERAKQTRIIDELLAAGRRGQKSGAGFYSYAKGPRGADDPAFEAILQRCRTSQRNFVPDEITDRLFLPMLPEASRVLGEGIVREPADVDMGLILGIGFPAWRGGLLRWADSLGLPTVVDKLIQFERLGPRFQATEQMCKLAAAGKGFYG
jgi:3-hydroxyacyl-CoA dehydrogenase/enoyl-CoA hydratase/3-hydroxybutyryl-CoA epimerase/3-hydroxyacyl-CoA dehydrogenase/enoyl-CoA hydratase/3-hydroxybutyryl-CoA epimerase/enoyl-CoA isomerase